MKLLMQLLTASAIITTAGTAFLQSTAGDEGTPTSALARSSASPTRHEASPIGGLSAGLEAMLGNFGVIQEETFARMDYDRQAIDAVSAMTAALTPDAILASANALRAGSSIPASTDPLRFGVLDSDPTVGWTEQGDTVVLEALQLHPSGASLWEVCAEFEFACEYAQLADDAFPDLTHGTYSAQIGPLLSVGVYANAKVQGASTTVLSPFYVIPATSPLVPSQYAEFLRFHLDELFPQDLDFLFSAGTDTVLAPMPGDPCLTQAVMDCITLRILALQEALRRHDRDYKKAYNDLLAAAQEDARRCSPIHSIIGFLRFVSTLGIEPALSAVEIWEDFAADVENLNEDYRTKVCDEFKDAANDIMACLGDCPLEIRNQVRGLLDIALAESGC